MQNIRKFPDQKAQDALRILDETYAYYEPQPIVVKEPEKQEEGIVPYYSAA